LHPDKLAPSPTWRTFLTYHFGHLILSSTVTPLDAFSDDGVGGDGSARSFGGAPSSSNALCASNQWVVARCRHAKRTVPPSLRRRTRAGAGKDPPQLLRRRDGSQTRMSIRTLYDRGPLRAGTDAFAECDHAELDFSTFICNHVGNAV
jgi:hypothetical protein